jgi:hypothetical protein
MKIRSVGAELFHADGRADRQTDRLTDKDTAKLIVAFRNPENRPKFFFLGTLMQKIILNLIEIYLQFLR